MIDQLVQGGQHGIDARQRVRLGPAQRRESQGRQIPLQRRQVELPQRQVMQQVEGAGPVKGRDLFEFLRPGPGQRDLLVAELAQGFDGSGGFLLGESGRHETSFQGG